MKDYQDEAPKRDGKLFPKKNGLLFFGLNLLLIGPQIFRKFSLWGAAGAAALLLVLLVLTLKRANDWEPASRDLPLLAVFDLCVLLVLSHAELRGQFGLQNADFLLRGLRSLGSFWLIPAGAALCLARVENPPLLRLWVKALGRTAVGAGLLLMRWSSGSLLVFYGEGKRLLVMYLLCALVWYLLCTVSFGVEPEGLQRDFWLSRLLLAVFLVLCLLEPVVLREFLLRLADWAREAAAGVWWKTALTAAVLAGSAAAVYEYDRNRMGPDAAVLGILASGAVLLRGLTEWYFAFNGGLLLVFLVGSLFCLFNEAENRKTFGFANLVFLPLQLGALLAAAMLLKRGLWAMVLLLCVYGCLFFVLSGRRTTSKRWLFYWLTLLSCPPAAAAAYLWRMRFLPETMKALGAVYAVLALGMVILHWPHPDRRSAHPNDKRALCVLMALLSLAASARYGTAVQISFQEADYTASITLTARGEENAIRSAGYVWSGALEEPGPAVRRLSAGETVIPIEGEKLTVLVTDAFGASTEVTDWYPGWMRK